MASNASSQKSYLEQLSYSDRQIYLKKIACIGEDPYNIAAAEFADDINTWPGVSYPDIVNYLVLSPNPAYTLEEMKAYKGLDAHNQFTSGWVRDVGVCYKEGKAVITGRVLHSQSISKTATKPWVIAEKDGNIITASCDCKAGLGGTCTHVSAVLFRVEASIRLREQKTVTQEKAYWMLPSSVRDIPYSSVSEIDFTSAKSKKKNLDAAIETGVSQPQPKTAARRKTASTAPTEPEIEEFLEKLNVAGSKSAILTITAPFNSQFVPVLSSQPTFPKPLTDLKSEKFVGMHHAELLAASSDINISVTQQQADMVESKTRPQAKCKLWFLYRAGRITASRMKAVCHTSVKKPSKSLIKAICYPESAEFKAPAAAWGCEHEKYALEDYTVYMRANHDNFKIQDAGFFINPEQPWMGASPDGVLSCDCCGQGVLEVKCPYCLRDGKKSAEGHACLISNDGESSTLDKKHQYYYQVQTQLLVCQKEYCDFVVWGTKDLHAERIVPDTEFQEAITKKASVFFREIILLELLGKFFSRTIVTDAMDVLAARENVKPDRAGGDVVAAYASATSSGSSGSGKLATATTGTICEDTTTTAGSTSDTETWCLCRDKEHGRMIACDSQNCPIVWFHYGCVGVKRKPRGQWLCPECRKAS